MLNILTIIFTLTYSLIAPNEDKIPPLKIALVSMDEHNLKETKKIAKYLESYYNCKIDILPAELIPKHFFKNGSDTLLSTGIFHHLRTIFRNSTYDKYIGVTERPIFVNDNFPFVRGVGELDGNFCIVSTNKIKHEANGNKKLFRRLLKKVSRHEIGHTLNLNHCELNKNCVMVSGVDDITFLNAKPVLCDSCKKKILPFLNH